MWREWRATEILSLCVCVCILTLAFLRSGSNLSLAHTHSSLKSSNAGRWGRDLFCRIRMEFRLFVMEMGVGVFTSLAVGGMVVMAQTRGTQPSVGMAVELQVLERSGSAIASTCRRPPTSSHRSQLKDCSPSDFDIDVFSCDSLLFQPGHATQGFIFYFLRRRRRRKETHWETVEISLIVSLLDSFVWCSSRELGVVCVWPSRVQFHLLFFITGGRKKKICSSVCVCVCVSLSRHHRW
jgi:hypothetical protein